MRFKNRAEKLQWLKSTGQRIQQMQRDRHIAVMAGDFARAYGLLAGIQFARREFAKVSQTLKSF